MQPSTWDVTLEVAAEQVRGIQTQTASQARVDAADHRVDAGDRQLGAAAGRSAQELDELVTRLRIAA